MRQAGATLHRGARASHYRGLSLRSTGSGRAGSVVVAHGPSCSAACGILPDQGSNTCPLHWQAGSNHCATREAPRCALKVVLVGFADRWIVWPYLVLTWSKLCFHLMTNIGSAGSSANINSHLREVTNEDFSGRICRPEGKALEMGSERMSLGS